MSESLSALDVRRRRLRFRCWHRGMREVDLLMGGFADAAIDDLSEPDLDALEALLEDVQDRDIFAWLVGETPLPAQYDTPLFGKLRAFHDHDRPVHA